MTLSTPPEAIKVRNFPYLNMTEGRAWGTVGHFQPSCAMVSKETVRITLPGLETRETPEVLGTRRQQRPGGEQARAGRVAMRPSHLPGSRLQHSAGQTSLGSRDTEQGESSSFGLWLS